MDYIFYEMFANISKLTPPLAITLTFAIFIMAFVFLFWIVLYSNARVHEQGHVIMLKLTKKYIKEFTGELETKVKFKPSDSFTTSNLHSCIEKNNHNGKYNKIIKINAIAGYMIELPYWIIIISPIVFICAYTNIDNIWKAIFIILGCIFPALKFMYIISGVLYVKIKGFNAVMYKKHRIPTRDIKDFLMPQDFTANVGELDK